MSSCATAAGYRHLLLKGRLRLGTIVSPRKEALYCLLSFGLTGIFWFRRAVFAVVYHLDSPIARRQMKPGWWMLIPGLQTILLYRLAKIVLQMEVQNHYRRTSPLLTMLLACFPPLAIYYLQRALNMHWLKHARQFPEA